MTFKTQQLLDQFSDLILSTSGNHTEFDHCADPNNCNQTSLVFLTDDRHRPDSAAVVVTTSAIAENLDNSSSFIVIVNDPRFAMAKMKEAFDDYLSGDFEWDAIHSSAIIHPSAKLGKECRVGPNAVIGANCIIGDYVYIRANAVVEHDVVIGDNTLVNSGTNIGYGTRIGQNVILQSCVVIANEGFGFAQDANKAYHHIPHTGNVIIEDDVWLGAGTCVDRATYGSTIIKRGVKIDNQCHVAHNVFVDEDALWVAQTGIAGSSHIGKRVLLSGQSAALDHKKIADDAILVHRAGVTSDIPHGGMWAGTPAVPFKEYMKDLRVRKRVDKLEERIKQLQDQLNFVSELNSDVE